VTRSINKAIIVGNLTRDPEMRYTPNGQSVTTFGVATNRRWASGEEQHEETEFHNVVAWGKLAEICSQLLKKGRKVYIEGRLQTRSWEGKDGVARRRTEIVAQDMVILDRRPDDLGGEGPSSAEGSVTEGSKKAPSKEVSNEKKGKAKKEKAKSAGAKGGKGEVEVVEDIDPVDIPF
jgi:single-strand DNA-binding protein